MGEFRGRGKTGFWNEDKQCLKLQMARNGEKGFSAAPRQREPQWLLTWVNVILKRYQFVALRWRAAGFHLWSLKVGHSSSILDTFVVSAVATRQSWQATGEHSCATVGRKVRSGSNDVDPVTKHSTGLQLLQLPSRGHARQRRDSDWGPSRLQCETHSQAVKVGGTGGPQLVTAAAAGSPRQSHCSLAAAVTPLPSSRWC